MVRLTRLNQKELVVNAELIQWVESSPDTVITLTTGEKVMVRETVDEVVEAVIRYRRRVHGLPDRLAGEGGS
jgi:flagellar protein FlbD